jgi:hypothetical protein
VTEHPRRYRKRPVEVEAWLVNDLIRWFSEDGWPNVPRVIVKAYDAGIFIVGASGPEGRKHDNCKDCTHVAYGPLRGIYLSTLEGSMWAGPHDWIIRGVAGEFYPCRADIFAATYEEVE